MHMTDKRLITVAELPSFTKQATKLLSKDEINDLINYLAANPEAGDMLEGTGGIRKIRWTRSGMGKSGGARVIYFYYNDHHPLLLIEIFAKNVKENLDKAERNQLAKLTEMLVSIYRRKQ